MGQILSETRVFDIRQFRLKRGVYTMREMAFQEKATSSFAGAQKISPGQ